MPVSTEPHLRREIVRVGKLLYDKGLIVATDGNVSARLDANRVLATPSGLCKGFMEPEQLIVVDLDGNRVGPANTANRNLKPTSEMRMHLEAYRRRPDIGAVVHAHPVTSVALSIAGVSLAECVVPEAIVVLGLVPTTAYSTPASEENQRAISEVILGHDAIILQYHGTLTVGRTLMEAYLRLETLEHTAKIIALTRLLGGGPALPPEQVAKLIQARQEGGFARPGDEEEFCLACGVCHAQGRHAPGPAAWDDASVDAEARLVREIAERVRRALQG